MKKWTTEELRGLWSNGQKIVLDGISYNVKRMSYGDYFFEPGPEKGEKDGFNHGTLWPEPDKGIWTIA